MFPLCSGRDLPQIGTQAAVITFSNPPDELAYAVVGAGVQEFRRFSAVAPHAVDLGKDMVRSEAVMPIHPGALKFS